MLAGEEGRRSVSAKSLNEVHGPSNFAEAQASVDLDAVSILKFSVAGEFAITAGACPVFNESNEGATDAAIPMRLGDKPAFEIWDGCVGSAFNMVASNRNLGHADDFSVELGQRDESRGSECLLDFEIMTLRRTVGPKRVAKLSPRNGMFGGGGKNGKTAGFFGLFGLNHCN